MIKNINELLSFIVLVLLFLYSQSMFFYANFKTKMSERKNYDEEYISKWQLFKEYNDNVEE